jgi:tetratricopeptide (TPR) repeat protein
MQETYQIRDEIVSAKWQGSAMLNFWNFDAALGHDGSQSVIMGGAIQRTWGALIILFGARRTATLLVTIWLLLPCSPALGLQQRLLPLAEESFVSGTNAMKRGDCQAAITAFRKVVRLQPTFAPAYQNIGLAYFTRKDYPKAIAWFSQGLKLDDELYGARLFLGISYIKIGAPSKAIGPLLGALRSDARDPQVYTWLGRAYFASGEYKLAAPYLEKARTAFPEDASIEYTLGRAYELLAQEIFKDIYQKNPQSPFVPYFLGKTFIDEGRLDLAIVQFNRALKIDPNFGKAHEALANIYEKQHNDTRAEDELQKELQIDPYNLIIRCELAAILIDERRPEKALRILREAANLNPSLYCAQYELGSALLRIGDPSRAVPHLRAATAAQPNSEPAHYSLGQAYQKLGKTAQAAAEFQTLSSLQRKKEQQVKKNFEGAMLSAQREAPSAH